MCSSWEYKFINKNWANIWNNTLITTNPEMTKLPFSVQKEILKGFKALEKCLLIHPNIIGWVSWTKLKHQHMMVFFTKVGARPYYIDIKLKTIWFRKVLNRS